MAVDVDVVLAGAGSNGPAEEGALGVIRRHFSIVRAGGSSAGAINAAAECAGIPAADLWARFLTSGKLEDWKVEGPFHPFGVLRGPGHGMIQGEQIRLALEASMGDMRMGDLRKPCRVTACNLRTGETEVVDSVLEQYKRVRVVDALRCSLAVPFVIDAWRLSQASTVWYADGGTCANAPAGLFDDSERPTILVRFAPDTMPNIDDGVLAFAKAVFASRQRATSETMPSKKPNLEVIQISVDGDSLNFSLDAAEVARRREIGIKAAEAWLNRQPKILQE